MTQSTQPTCPVCTSTLDLRIASSKKGRTSLMLICHVSGKHFRGFTADRDYVSCFVAELEDGS